MKRKSLQYLAISVLSFIVLFMSIGFAAYTQNIVVRNMQEVSASSWDVHFDPSSFMNQEAEGSVPATSKKINGTVVSFSTVLEKPGDYYAFTIPVENSGTIDAVLDSIVMSELTATQQHYVDYTVTYDGMKFTSTTTGLNIGLPHDVSANTRDVVVRVEYLKPGRAIDYSKLPAQELNLNLTLNYSQAK